MDNRWEYFSPGSAIHRDWRSLRLTTSLSPQTGLGRGEMKKTTKKVQKKNETQNDIPNDIPIVVKGTVISPREHDDFIGRDPRSVR